MAYAFQPDRRAIRLKTVAWGLGLQFAFAVCVLRVEPDGASFKPLQRRQPLAQLLLRRLAVRLRCLGKQGSSLGFYFAFQVLPQSFSSARFSPCYTLRRHAICHQDCRLGHDPGDGRQRRGITEHCGQHFMGQTEAPVTIRPFLPDLTHSELMTVMTSGMAHVSGGIMAAYIAFGIEPKHLLSAVIMTAPGTLLMAKMLVPETEQPRTAGRVVMPEDEEKTEKEENLLGAVARGTTDGLHMALNIAAMLIAFLALIALADGIMGGVHHWLAWFQRV